MAPYQAEQNQMALDQAEPNQMGPNQAKLDQMAQHQAQQKQIASEHPDPVDFSFLYAHLVLPFLLANTFQEQGVQQQRAHFHAFF
jgi:hypothetical protein